MTRTTKELLAEARAEADKAGLPKAAAERDVLEGIVQAAMLAVTGKSYSPYADHNLVVAIRASEGQLSRAQAKIGRLEAELSKLASAAADAYVAKHRDGWEAGPTESEADARIVHMCAHYGADVFERLAKLRGEPWPPAALSDALEVA